VITAKLSEIVEGAEALKKLADNAKLPPVIFFRVMTAWRDVRDQIDVRTQALRALTEDTTRLIERIDARTNDSYKADEYIDTAARKRYFDGLHALDCAEVELPRVSGKLSYAALLDAKADLTPAMVASLLWLIDIEEPKS